jgi:tonB-dependent receptor plug
MKRNDDIKDYLRGNRKGKPAHQLEREALSDPFLYEALEGLTTTPSDPIDGLIRLERHLDTRARSSRKKSRGWLYVAASFLVLAICGTVWLLQVQDEKAGFQTDMAQLSPENTRSAGTLILSNGKRVDLLEKDTLKDRQPEEEQVKMQRSAVEDKQEKAVVMSADVAEVQVNDSSAEANMQTNVVEGIVTDEKNEPIPGVSVMISGTSTGICTDQEGRFRMDILKEKAHMTFSFIGMETQGFEVTAGSHLNVKLKAQAVVDDVVVTGLGKRENLKMKSATASGDSVMPKIRLRGMSSVVSSAPDSLNDVALFNQYMEKALRFPKTDLEANHAGVIQVSFVLNKKKVPSSIRIKDGFSKESNKEMIRLLAEGPKWENTPAGERIHVKVYFTIQDKDKQKVRAVLELEKTKK